MSAWAAQNGLHAGDEFTGAEGFRDVVVRAAAKPEMRSSSSLRAVSMMIGTGPQSAQPAAHLEPGHSRQHQVQHHEIWGSSALGQLQGARSVSGADHRISGVRQVDGHHVSDGAVVIDDEHERPALVAVAVMSTA